MIRESVPDGERGRRPSMETGRAAVARPGTRCRRPTRRPGVPGLAVLAALLAADPAASATPEHPRLLFGRADIASLRARAEDADRGALGLSQKELFSSLRRDADLTLARAARLPSTPPREQGRFKDVAIAFEQGVVNLSFVYVVTGERKYLDAARESLEQIAAWNRWSWWSPRERTGTLDLGAITAGFAVAYDLLHDSLSASERSRMRQALVAKGIVPLYEGADRGDKWPFNSPEDNNWFIAGAAPLGLGALSLLGEEREAQKWLDKAILETRRFLTLTSRGSNGGYAEGVTYGNYAVTKLVRFGDALARVTGVELEQGWLRAYPYFLLYTLLPDGRGHLNFNDENGKGLGDTEVMVRATTRYPRDPVSGHAQWYLQRFGDPGGRGWLNPFVFIAFDPHIAPSAPSRLARYRWFTKVGWVVYRTGWEAGDLFFAFKAQSSAARADAHLHYDGGQIVLYRDEWLLTDPGYQLGSPWGRGAARGQKALNFFTRGSWGHNTLTVDDMSQSRFASRISRVFGSDQLLGIRADLTDSYHSYRRLDTRLTRGDPLLERCLREVLVVPPRYLIVVDRVRTSGGPRRIESLFHGGRYDSEARRPIHPTIRIEGRDFGFAPAGSSSRLGARVVLPADAVVAAATYEGIREIGEYVSVGSSQKVEEVELVVIVYPSRPGEKAPAVTRVTSDGLVGLEIETEDASDTVVFNRGQGVVEFGGVETDAATALVRRGRDQLELASLLDGTFLTWRGRPLFRSDRPASAVSDGATAVLETEETTEASLFSRAKGGLVRHSLGKGRTEIEPGPAAAPR